MVLSWWLAVIDGIEKMVECCLEQLLEGRCPIKYKRRLNLNGGNLPKVTFLPQ